MNTTYDQIAEAFLDNCGYNPQDLPKGEEVWLSMVKNVIRIYNNKLNRYSDYFNNPKVNGDDYLEELDVKLNDDELLIMAYIFKYVFLKNEFTYFTSVWGTFTKELGMRNYKDQVSARRADIRESEKYVDELIQNVIGDWDI